MDRIKEGSEEALVHQWKIDFTLQINIKSVEWI